MRLVKARKRHYNSAKIDFSFEPSSSRFSFANGEQSNVREKFETIFRMTNHLLWVDFHSN